MFILRPCQGANHALVVPVVPLTLHHRLMSTAPPARRGRQAASEIIVCVTSIKCTHAIRRRGGYSPPASVTEPFGRGIPAPTLLLQLIIKHHQAPGLGKRETRVL